MSNFPKIGNPQYGPQQTIIFIIGTPKMVAVILGDPVHALAQGASKPCCMENKRGLGFRV